MYRYNDPISILGIYFLKLLLDYIWYFLLVEWNDGIIYYIICYLFTTSIIDKVIYIIVKVNLLKNKYGSARRVIQQCGSIYDIW